MFVEPTAHHLCDSGGIYGRQYQKNQGKDLNAEPQAVLNRWGVTVNVYRCLKSLLSEDRLCKEFNALPCEDWDSDFYGCSADQQTWLRDQDFTPLGEAQNTYNWETNFSQIVQYQKFDRDGETYVLLQVHGGCDARSGYTDAKLFYLDSWDADYFLLDDASFYLEPGQAPNPFDFPISLDVYGSHVTAYHDGEEVDVPRDILWDLPEDLNVEGSARAVEH